MSFRQALRIFPRLAPAARPVVARATPSLLQSSARHAAVAPRLFNSSAIAHRQAADPKWTKGTPITYEELKPITQSPSDVSSQRVLVGRPKLTVVAPPSPAERSHRW